VHKHYRQTGRRRTADCI